MNREFRFKILSLLLRYPDREFAEMAGEIGEAAEEIFEGDDFRRIGGFLNAISKKTLLELQERYCSAFDLNPSTCLNLAYHKHGDGKERGIALARLREEYESSGHETATSELPDFLPLVLEFLSVCDESRRRMLLDDYAAEVAAIGNRLKDAGSDYAPLFDVISGMIVGKSAEKTQQETR